MNHYTTHKIKSLLKQKRHIVLHEALLSGTILMRILLFAVISSAITVRDDHERIFRHHELDEVLGVLHGIEKSPDGCIVAQIGKIPTWLPPEMEPTLKVLIGRKIGILKLNGYRLRVLDAELHAR